MDRTYNYRDLTWVLCVPDPARPHRLIPYLHHNRGTVWFSELQYIDRFIRENPALPSGTRSRAILDRKTLFRFATQLQKAGVQVLYFDLEYGKDSPGESLADFSRRLEEGLQDSETGTPRTLSRSMRFRVQGNRQPG